MRSRIYKENNLNIVMRHASTKSIRFYLQCASAYTENTKYPREKKNYFSAILKHKYLKIGKT